MEKPYNKLVSQVKSLEDLSVKVLKFINDFKKAHPAEIEDVFLNGYCFWFAKILNLRFNGEIFYLPIMNHFIVKIEDKYYDITGEVVLEEKPYEWNSYSTFDYLDYKRVRRDCILKEDDALTAIITERIK